VEVPGLDPAALDVQADRLARAVAGGARDEIRATVDEVDLAVARLERDLIKEASRRATTAHRLAEYEQRYTELVAATASVSALAVRCRDRITDPPTLAVPDASVVGPPPTAPAPESSDAAAWAATGAQLDEYAQRLDRVGRALEEAERAYGAPLAERDDLRGLLGAYRTRAARNGLAEDPRLTGAYEAARDLLWSAPCDISLARERVEEYQHAVRAAVGVESGPEIAREGEPS
jgi:hypothetical protein